MKADKLVCGVGVNDAGYPINIQESFYVDGKRKRRVVWCCPYYKRWVAMLNRCYNTGVQQRQPTYADCSVDPSWFVFSTFKRWMEQQIWEGNQLDKDLLIEGNKVYGPDTCIFISQEVNTFIIPRKLSDVGLPAGVTYHKTLKGGWYKAVVVDGDKYVNLGKFDTVEKAQTSYLERKQTLATELASRQTDKRVADALIARYGDEWLKAGSSMDSSFVANSNVAKKYAKVCISCSKDFTSSRKDSKSCSNICRSAFARKLKRIP